jgi:serine/threonine-protein phosphatase 5
LEEDSTSTSTSSSSAPSAVWSEESAETVAYNTGLSLDEVVDHSHDEAAEAKGLELKNQGNQELVEGHFLKAIRLYSEALEYAPTNAIILSNRAQAYIKVENYGLAISDATHAIQHDPTYAKGYYRRASAYFALNKYKQARKDFRKVCSLKPQDRDARAKLAGCEKAVKEEAFSKAIVSEATEPLSATYNVDAIVMDAGYDGPHPMMVVDGPTTSNDMDADAEQALFQPGKLPLDFVMVSLERNTTVYVVRIVWLENKTISHSITFRLLGFCEEIQGSKDYSQALCGEVVDCL